MLTFGDLTIPVTTSYMDDRHLCAVDALSCYNIQFTYERDDGLARSWPDHVLTLSHCINDITDVRCMHSPDNFSDHIPSASV